MNPPGKGTTPSAVSTRSASSASPTPYKPPKPKTKTFRGLSSATPLSLDTANLSFNIDINSAQKSKKHCIPTTIENLCLFFDWRETKYNANLNKILYKVAALVWQYLPPTPMAIHSVSFADARKHDVYPLTNRSPLLVTTSIKGDLLAVFEVEKQMIEYKDKVYLMVLYPVLDNLAMKGVSSVRAQATNEHCTWWEIDGLDHLTHVCFDRTNTIYFTSGETVYRIPKLEDLSTDAYSDEYEDIYSPSNDTSHITSLWRQNNDAYFSVQDWSNEDNLDVYRIRQESANAAERAAGSDSPGAGTPSGRSPSFQRRRTSSRGNMSSGSPRYGGSAVEIESEYVQKMRTFTLQHKERIWQLSHLRFEKKFVLAISAARPGGYSPLVLRIGFKTKIRVLNVVKKGIVWPSVISETSVQGFYNHRPTKTWFLIMPVCNVKKKKKLFWLQFKLDQQKKKVTWHRLIELPEAENETMRRGEWLYYDEVRDVLVGFYQCDAETQEYQLKFLPDMSKYLWVEQSSAKSKVVAVASAAAAAAVKKLNKNKNKNKTKTKKTKSSSSNKASTSSSNKGSTSKQNKSSTSSSSNNSNSSTANGGGGGGSGAAKSAKKKSPSKKSKKGSSKKGNKKKGSKAPAVVAVDATMD